MKRYETVLGIPLSLPLDQLSAQIAVALGIEPRKRSSYFRAGDYDLFALPTGEAYLQRNYDEGDATAAYATEAAYPYLLERWAEAADFAGVVNHRINAALGVNCPILNQVVLDHPFFDL